MSWYHFLPPVRVGTQTAHFVKWGVTNSYKLTNKMQLCRISLLFSCFLVALHVSSDVIAHHQEYLNYSHSFWLYSRVSLSVAVSSRQDTRE